MPQTWLTDCVISILTNANRSIFKYAFEIYSKEEYSIVTDRMIMFFKDFYNQLRLFPLIKRNVLDNIINMIYSQLEDKDLLNLGDTRKVDKLLEESNENKTKDLTAKLQDESNYNLSSRMVKQLNLLKTELEFNGFIDIEIEKELTKRNIPIFSIKSSFSSNI